MEMEMTSLVLFACSLLHLLVLLPSFFQNTRLSTFAAHYAYPSFYHE